MWDWVGGYDILVLSDHTYSINEIAFRSDGKHLAAVGEGGVVRLWSASEVKLAGVVDRQERIHAHQEKAPGYWREKGLKLGKANRPQESYAAFTKAIKVTDTVRTLFENLRAELLLDRALLLRRMSRFEESKRDIYKFWKTGSSNGREYNSRAWHLVTGPLELREPERAVLLARKAILLEPDNWAIHNTLGVAFYRAGEFRQAIVVLLEAGKLRKEGLSGIDLFFLAMTHYRLGDLAKAKEYYAQAAAWRNENKDWLHNDLPVAQTVHRHVLQS